MCIYIFERAKCQLLWTLMGIKTQKENNYFSKRKISLFFWSFSSFFQTNTKTSISTKQPITTKTSEVTCALTLQYGKNYNPKFRIISGLAFITALIWSLFQGEWSKESCNLVCERLWMYMKLLGVCYICTSKSNGKLNNSSCALSSPGVHHMKEWRCSKENLQPHARRCPQLYKCLTQLLVLGH